MEESCAYPERRSQPRFAVDEDATLVMVNAGATISGRMFEISRDGCRVRTAGRHPIAAPALIEIIFKVNGIAFRLGGVIEWIEHEKVAGIRFGAMALRRRETLEELLAEMGAEEQARAAAQALAEGTGGMPKEAAGPAASASGCVEPVPRKSLTGPSAAERRSIEPAAPAPTINESRPAAQPAPRVRPASKRERRQEVRHTVDTRAMVFLIDVRAQISGRILDVSMSGCRIRTDERFPVGIYRRVETEFKVDGLPFRLGGVVQGLHDRFTVGIRFLDMSPRKRDQLGQLMEEIAEDQLVPGAGAPS